MRPVESKVFHTERQTEDIQTDRQTDRHDKANSRFFAIVLLAHLQRAVIYERSFCACTLFRSGTFEHLQDSIKGYHSYAGNL